jgi:uncharacterized protein YkwD
MRRVSCSLASLLALLALLIIGCAGCTEDGADGGDGDGDGGTEGGVGNAYCEITQGWDPGWSALETDVLDLVNQYRAQGANCGSQGQKAPAPPLSMQANLRCAARVHSEDMDARSFFDHVNPSGEEPWDRFDRAGYTGWNAAGENIAAGSPDAAGTMAQWMGSDGHCANIMNPDFTEIGVGYYPGGQYGHLWTQTFGRR